jgi:hypothetical protein
MNQNVSIQGGRIYISGPLSLEPTVMQMQDAMWHSRKSVDDETWILWSVEDCPNNRYAVELLEPDEEPEEPARPLSWYFWKFVHNMLIHPLLALPWEPKWAQDAHDWTAKHCPGGG